jgi:3-dehydroquinate synthase
MKRTELKVAGLSGATQLSIGGGALEEAGRAAARYPTVLLVTDESLAETPWPVQVESACEDAGGPEPIRLLLPAGEDYKSLEVAAALCNQWLEVGAGRDAIVVGVGGGVVTDLAGFSASIYLRGIPWLAVPTTVLAMADASIGGKTGVNLGEGKNMLGSFWHPLSVHADPVTLTTLEDGDYRDGWAEVVKAGAIADRALFERLEFESDAIHSRDLALAADLLAASIAVKTSVVAADAREAGPREILNFGHTVGHAIEMASDHEVSHGEAVAMGMVAEARVGAELGHCGEDLSESITSCCKALGLSTTLPDGIRDEILMAAMILDKKRRDGLQRIALPTELGAHDPASPCVEVDADALIAATRS